MSYQKRINTCRRHLYPSLKETFWVLLGCANRKEAHPQLFKWILATSRNQQVHLTCRRPITLHEAINTHTSFSTNHNKEGWVSCNGCRLINFFHFCLMRLALPSAFQRSRLLTFTARCWDALALGPASHPPPSSSSPLSSSASSSAISSFRCRCPALFQTISRAPDSPHPRIHSCAPSSDDVNQASTEPTRPPPLFINPPLMSFPFTFMPQPQLKEAVGMFDHFNFIFITLRQSSTRNNSFQSEEAATWLRRNWIMGKKMKHFSAHWVS